MTLTPGPTFERQQSEAQRIGTAGDADRMLAAGEACKIGLECIDHGTADERRPIDGLLHQREDLRLEGPMLLGQIEERHRAHRRFDRQPLVLGPNLAQYVRGIAGDDGVRRHIPCDHAARADDGARADGDAAQNRRVAADGSAALHQRCLALPVGSALLTAVGGSGAREAIVDEHDAVTDEDLVFQRHALADERVALHLDFVAEAGAALDLDERADGAVVADGAAVEVAEAG